jgi:tRNA pseudouridine38-40 synthase
MTTRTLAPYQWLRASNSYLPKDISVRSVEQVPDSFHARYSARGKQYEYHILNRAEHSPLQRHRAWTVYKALDIRRMSDAAAHLIGARDFSSFEGSPTDNENPHCRLQRLDVAHLGETVVIAAYADRFLKQMVRAIVGTLVEVGLEKRTVESMEAILNARHRSAAGQTAPAHGLYLMRVDY